MQKFSFDDHFQKNYVAFLLRDPVFFGRVHSDVTADLFTSTQAQKVVRIILGFAEEHHAPPGELIYTELENLQKHAVMSEQDLAPLKRYIKELLSLDLHNQSFLLQEHDKFMGYQRLVEVFPKFSNAMKDGDYEQANTLLTNLVTRTSKYSDLGNFFSDDPSERIERRGREDGERFLLGIPELDATIQGLKRRQIGVWLSQRSSAGKSAALIHLTKWFVMQGKQVLCVTMEDTKEDFEDKLDMCVSGVHTEGLRDGEVIRAAMRRWFRREGRVHIAEFPPSKISELRAYAAYLKQVHNWIPDAVILDYAGLCKPEISGSNSYDTGDQVYSALSTWAKEEDCIIWTASQSGRGAMEAVHADQQHTAGSIAVIYHSHLVISINRTSQEQSDGLTNLHVVKNKNGQARFDKVIHSDFDRMHFRTSPKMDD